MVLLGVFGFVMLATAGWMLAAPAHWWANLPGRVPDFGPLNEHFVRDIGALFLTFGSALWWAAAVPAVRFPVLAVVTLWNVAHAFVHVWDTVRGLVDASHWTLDIPGIYAPTVGLIVLTVLAARARNSAA